MFSRSLVSRLLACVAVLCLASSAQAQLYWDILNHTPTTPSGGAGNWTAGGLDWSNLTADVAWQNGQVAVFGGTAGTVSVASPGMTVSGLTFNTDAYTLTGISANALGLTGAGTTNTVAVGNGLTTTFSNFFSGGNGLNFNSPGGTGIFTVANTNTGGFTLTAGTVRTTNQSFAGTSAGTLTLAGGNLVNNTAASNTTLTFANPLSLTGDVTLTTTATTSGTSGGLNFSSNLSTTTGDRTITLVTGGTGGVITNALNHTGLLTLGGNLTFTGSSSPAFTGGLASTASRTLTFNNTGTNVVLRGSGGTGNINNFNFSGSSVLTVAGTSSVAFGSTSGIVSGTLSGGIVFNGPTVTFSSTNATTFNDFTTPGYRIDSGIVTIPGSNATPALVNNLPAAPITIRGGQLRSGSTSFTDSIHNLIIDGVNGGVITIGSATAGVGITFASANQSIINNPTITFLAGTPIFTPPTTFLLNSNVTFGGTSTGNGTFSSGLDFNNIARTININRANSTANVNLNGAAVNTVAGNSVNILAGTISIGNSTALGNGVTTVNLTPNNTFQSNFTLTGTGTSVNLAGNLTFGGSGSGASTVAIGANSLTPGANVVYDVTGNAALAAATISGTAANPGLNFGAVNRSIIVGDSSVAIDLTISAPITGTAGFTKSGDGVLALTGNNSTTLVGGTNTVSAGRVIVTVDGALGDITGGTTVASGATISFGAVPYTSAEPLTINGSGAAGRTGALDLNSATSITIAPSITLGSAASIGNGAGAVFTLSGPINTAGFDLTFTNTNTTAANGNITGNGRLIKTGGQVLNLGGSANVLSEIVVQNGNSGGSAIIFTATSAPAVLTNTQVTIVPTITTGSLTVVFGSNSASLSGITFGGVANSLARISSDVGSVLTLNGGVTYDATNNPGQDLITPVNAGGTLDLGSAVRTFNIGRSTAQAFTASDLGVNIALVSTTAGGILKTGTGVVGFGTVGGNPNFLGTITINAGRVNAFTDGSLGAITNPVIVNSGGTLSFSVNYTTAKPVTINGTGDPTRGGAIDLNSASASFAGPITLGSAATIGNISGTAAARLTLTGAINNAGFLLTVAGSQPFTLSGVISGSGGLTKTGAGNITLGGGAADTAPNTYTGLTTFTGTTATAPAYALSKATNTTVIPGDFLINSGQLNTIAASNQFAATTNWTMAGGTVQGTSTGITQTLASFTQTGGTWSTGTAAIWNFSGAVTTTDSTLTINSGTAFTAGSISYNGSTGVYAIGNNNATRTVVTIGSGGLAVNSVSVNTSSGGSGTTAGSTIVLNGNVASSGTAGLTRSSATTNDPSGLTGAVDFNGGSRTITVATGGIFTVAVPLHNGNLIKDGSGALYLNAVNPNTGGAVTALGTITVSAGVLLVGSTAAANTATIPSGANPVDVASGGTIGGFGTVNRGIALNGTLAPGGSIGQLTTSAGPTTWNRGATYAFEYDTISATPVAGTNNDHFLGTGTATLDLSTLTPIMRMNLILAQIAGLAPTTDLTYTIATFPTGAITLPGTITGNDLTPYFNISGPGSTGASVTFVSGATDSIVLTIPLPEPLALVAVGGLAVLALRRRKA